MKSSNVLKRWLFTTILISMLSGLVVGCDKSDNKNSDPFRRYGYYDNGFYYDGVNDYRVDSNAVILSGRINITDVKSYRNYLLGIGACFKLFGENNCSWVDNAPGLTILVDNYKFSGTTANSVIQDPNTSPGTVIIHTQSGPANYNVIWRLYDQGLGFDTQQTQPPGTPGYNQYVKIRITGRTTDRYVRVELLYGSTVFGYGQLDRVIQQ